ncbi:sister chromatid cohesion C-terminus-domain-containing protein [Truncatella angustata]|uniref:Sister chromatid cohesion protein n=1 Tax=Truncatella angustata TaxID=152316 RepID=A0A9P9A2Q2_9PEZI|nr:sister chromatid cohesion C-terminus-domain-containing protein [Truncatella angustata]KAH6659657.1 sister chromatid cohesion C-terminus-domain-containing protein [Truncatella angustata]
MIYENTSIEFSHPASDTPKPQLRNVNGAAMAPKVPKKSPPKARKQDLVKVVKHNPASLNAQAVAKNIARIEVHLPARKDLDVAAAIYSSPKPDPQDRPVAKSATAQPQTMPLTGPLKTPQPVQAHSGPDAHRYQAPTVPMVPKSQIRIELPAASFNASEYMVVDDSATAPANLSTKRRYAQHQGNDELLDGNLNNRDRADAHLRELQRCLQEICNAEHLAVSSKSANPWISMTLDDEPTMTVAAYNRVTRLISRTFELDCFRVVPFEDLEKIQELCDPSLKHADALEIKIDPSWGEVSVNEWLKQLPDVEAGLKAARLALTIMGGGREEKKLYSEGLIQRGLSLFRSVMDDIVVPIAEMRNSAQDGSFKYLSAQKKAIGVIFTACQKLFALMTNLISGIDLSEDVINGLEVSSSQLIFVDSALSERDSIVGVQKFDGLRLVAMDMLCQIFLANPSQRQGILTDILTSLEKLPKAKQSSRQFKLSDGGSIQPVSALIMRLVQASAGKIEGRSSASGQIIESLESAEDDKDKSSADRSKLSNQIYPVKTDDHAAMQHGEAIQELKGVATPLFETARRNASFVINFLVKRAQKSTKTGDTPYRNLLDNFMEDFNLCLDSPDWPAAELLLRTSMIMMLELLKGEKTAAPAKNMALELLGNMAAAISKLRSHVRKVASNFEGSDADDLGRWLADLTSMVLERRFSPEKMISWLGPYRVVLEYLEDRVKEDPHLRSATSYLVTDWAVELCNAYNEEGREESEEQDSEYGRSAFRLRNMVDDRRWLTNEYSFKSVVANHAKLSHSIILLRSPFCDSFRGILNILLQSMTTDAATVRSRSLKSVNSVLDTDPSILDGDSSVIDMVLQCSHDPSPQVRDSALSLIGKCISMRPALEEKMIPTVIQRFLDSGVGVRKRAMKLAKDIYLGNENKQVRSNISNGLLHRCQDPDESVRELARQMIEEIWISPFYKADDSTAYRQSLTDHISLMIQTVKQNNSSTTVEKVFQAILAPQNKLADANAQVCIRLVASMFDLIHNPDSDDPSIPSGKDALQVLMIFAKADPKLFTFEQIRMLQPRISNVGSNEDLTSSRAVVAIYRRVLPQVTTVHSQFLADIRKDLMPAVSKVTRALLDDVIACLWIVSGLLGTSEHLARLVCSSLVGVQKIRAMSVKAPLDQQKTRQFDRYSLIVGMAGKHCNLDSHEQLFKAQFSKWSGGPVSKLMVDVLAPFASPSQPADVRKSALDAMGLVCQSNPRNFVAVNVYTTFQQAFDEQNSALESMVLRSFKEFLFTEEQRSELASAAVKDAKELVKKDLKVMGSTSFDDVASATTVRFLKDIIRITLATQDEHAFLATEVLASINRQGLVHPKETGITFITLETCPLLKVSELAYQEHRSLHAKHETVIEREYAKAVQSVFLYQRDIIKDPRGATTDPFTSKLHLLLDVLKMSKGKNRKRFFDKLISQVEFDPSALDISQPIPEHVEFSRFIVENIAFFEFAAIDELQALVTSMEKLVTNIGTGIAQSIESDVFQLRVDTLLAPQQPINGESEPGMLVEPQIDTQKLRQLTSGAMVLLAVWEGRTHLRRLYNLKANRDIKVKAGVKDPNKAPVKSQGVTGDKFWEDMDHIMSSLTTRERMIEGCRTFVDLINVDSEVKVGDDDEDMDADGDPRTPEAEDDDGDTVNGETRGRKRKASNTPGGKKKRARSDSKARPRGRPRKNPLPDAEPGSEQDADFDDF